MPKLTQNEILLSLRAQAPNKAAADLLADRLNLKYRQPRKPVVHHEDNFQIDCVKYLSLFPDIMVWSTPNHLYRGKNTNEGAFLAYMGKQKMMGLRKGVSDLCLFFVNKYNLPALCVAECKHGQLSP